MSGAKPANVSRSRTACTRDMHPGPAPEGMGPYVLATVLPILVPCHLVANLTFPFNESLFLLN